MGCDERQGVVAGRTSASHCRCEIFSIVIGGGEIFSIVVVGGGEILLLMH
jgi:hypothetical protein